MKKYSVRVLGHTSWCDCSTIKEARRENSAARRSGLNTVIVRNTDGEIVD